MIPRYRQWLQPPGILSDLILYPWGWQVRTPSFDDPIFKAQAGTDDNPAIWDSLLNIGYDPGVGADLYTTNGEFADWAYARAGTPAYTVEVTLGYDGPDTETATYYGFEFPDDEDMVQTVFEDNLEFALSLAESARTPSHPVSPVGITAENVAIRYNITREMQDEFAYNSQMKASKAKAEKLFTEIVPTPATKFVTQKDGTVKKETFIQDYDDGIRADGIFIKSVFLNDFL